MKPKADYQIKTRKQKKDTETHIDLENYDITIIDIKTKIQAIAEKNNIDELQLINEQLFNLLEKRAEEEDNEKKNNENNNAILIENFKELEEQCTSMQMKMKNDDERIKNLIQENEDQINEYKDITADLNNKIKELKQKITELESTNEQQNEAILNKQSIIDDILKEKKQTANKIETWEKYSKRLEEENEGLKISIEGLRRTIDELNINHQKNQQNDDTDKEDNILSTTIDLEQIISYTQEMKKANYQISYAQELEMESINNTINKSLNETANMNKDSKKESANSKKQTLHLIGDSHIRHKNGETGTNTEPKTGGSLHIGEDNNNQNKDTTGEDSCNNENGRNNGIGRGSTNGSTSSNNNNNNNNNINIEYNTKNTLKCDNTPGKNKYCSKIGERRITDTSNKEFNNRIGVNKQSKEDGSLKKQKTGMEQSTEILRKMQHGTRNGQN
ncbi:hypothetical protein M8J77_026232 [Diaphorina citri]|nr:hypothetical protein M8J77_026232 [Diaphorina citri]